MGRIFKSKHLDLSATNAYAVASPPVRGESRLSGKNHPSHPYGLYGPYNPYAPSPLPTYTTHSAEETEALAKQLLPEILNKRVVQLSGNLGSGKTTFVKGLAKALGIEKAVKSPTYTYQNKYQIPNPNNQKESHWSLELGHWSFLHHFDLYRLPEHSDHPDQVSASIGLEDALNDQNAIIIIEWPERLPIHIAGIKINFEKREKDHLITTR